MRPPRSFNGNSLLPLAESPEKGEERRGGQRRRAVVFVEKRRDLHNVEVLYLNAAPGEIGDLIQLRGLEAAGVARRGSGSLGAAHRVDVERYGDRPVIFPGGVQRLEENSITLSETSRRVITWPPCSSTQL